MRSDRRRDLLSILHEGHASSQQQIVRALKERGHMVTQATVSRDLRDVGAAKVRVGGEVTYRLPDDMPRSSTDDVMARHLARTLAEFAIDVRTAGSLVVLLTSPGHAGAVARAIDLAAPKEVIGTVAGDDTIFVATPGPSAGRRLAKRWLSQGEQTNGEVS